MSANCGKNDQFLIVGHQYAKKSDRGGNGRLFIEFHGVVYSAKQITTNYSEQSFVRMASSWDIKKQLYNNLSLTENVRKLFFSHVLARTRSQIVLG